LAATRCSSRCEADGRSKCRPRQHTTTRHGTTGGDEFSANDDFTVVTSSSTEVCDLFNVARICSLQITVPALIEKIMTGMLLSWASRSSTDPFRWRDDPRVPRLGVQGWIAKPLEVEHLAQVLTRAMIRQVKGRPTILRSNGGCAVERRARGIRHMDAIQRDQASTGDIQCCANPFLPWRRSLPLQAPLSRPPVHSRGAITPSAATTLLSCVAKPTDGGRDQPLRRRASGLPSIADIALHRREPLLGAMYGRRPRCKGKIGLLCEAFGCSHVSGLFSLGGLPPCDAATVAAGPDVIR
jgi:hypothetical protein